MNVNEIIKSVIKESQYSWGVKQQPEDNSTFNKLIKAAVRDGHLSGMEQSAQYVMDAAKQIATEFDELNHEEKKVFGETFYKKFLKQIHKI